MRVNTGLLSLLTCIHLQPLHSPCDSVMSGSFPAAPPALWIQSSEELLFLLSHSSRGVLAPSWLASLFFFFPPLSGCSSASFVCALLLVLYACYSFTPPLLLYPFSFSRERHLPSSGRAMSRASFCEHTNTVHTHREAPGLPFQCHARGSAECVSVCFLAEWHGINFQAFCIWNWRPWCFFCATQLVRWDRATTQINTH